jgi:hypothetical protein
MTTNQTAHSVERLWSTADGTVCLLAVHDTPPNYSITIVRGQEVLRERRVYGRAAAQMLAQGWSGNDDEPR